MSTDPHFKRFLVGACWQSSGALAIQGDLLCIIFSIILTFAGLYIYEIGLDKSDD